LTFKFPEEFYLYKYAVLKSAATFLGFKLTSDRLADCRQMYEAIREVASQDDVLVKMNRDRLGSDCYQDPNNRMLAQCIAYFAQKIQDKKEEVQRLAAKPAVVREFKRWLEEPTRKNGKPYDYKTVKVYIKQVEDEAKKLMPLFDGNINLYTYDTVDSYTPQINTLLQIISTSETQVNGAFPKVLRLYEQFLNERELSIPDMSEPSISFPVVRSAAYSPEKFLEEVFLTADVYNSLIDQLIRKKNLILEGAPGVGKTFAAIRLAYSIIGEKTSERICLVQFHQSYGYEDFVMGYRPNPDDAGFKMEAGVFYSFCRKAAADPDNEWFFIIDEINRGNISKILGELLMLIEADKRGRDYAVRIHGTDEPFYVPENVNIIGMMNTADRSIALIDYALRRRFAFYRLEPAFENESESFQDYMDSKKSKKLETIIDLVSQLNEMIAADPLLGSGYKIGHSYFCTDDEITSKLLREIILYEIKPLLSEYWFDDADKVREWVAKLLEVL